MSWSQAWKQEYVYFVQVEDGGPIKIGRARDPEKRLRELQIGNPHRLRVCRYEPMADPWSEARLHELFKDYRLVGEWFRAHPTLAKLADALPDPEIPEGEPLSYAPPPTKPSRKEGIWRWPITERERQARMEEFDKWLAASEPEKLWHEPLTEPVWVTARRLGDEPG